MRDLCVRLPHRPGGLAEVGEALGRAGVSVEGGGAFAFGNVAIAHFLVADAGLARSALASAGIEVLYSDQANQLILVVDQADRARRVSEAWMRERAGQR